MPKLIISKKYSKVANTFLKKNPHIIKQYYKTISLLELNPYHPSLRLHKLQGNLSDCFSVSINMQYRMLLYFIITEDRVVPIGIGKHDEMYM